MMVDFVYYVLIKVVILLINFCKYDTSVQKLELKKGS